MHSMTCRRLLAGPAAVAAALAATMAVPATPAFARGPQVAPGESGLGVFLPDTSVAAGGAGRNASIILFNASSEPLVNATLAFDFTDLAGVVGITATAGTGAHCTSPSPGHLTCTDPSEFGVNDLGLGFFSVTVVPATNATAGESGTLKATFSATGVQAASDEATVRIGEGVDLAAEEGAPVPGRPGGALTTVASVRNAGTTPVEGAVLLFDNDYALHPGKHHSNCTYSGDALLACRFAGTLAPDATYGAPVAYRLGADTLAPSTQASEVLWMTPTEFDDLAGVLAKVGVSLGTPGTEPALALAELPDGAGRSAGGAVQVDTQPDNNGTTLNVSVTGRNGADLVAVGDTLAGVRGDLITASVGLVNNGPATLDVSRTDSPVTRVDVGVPEGTTAVGVPGACAPLVGGVFDGRLAGQPGAPAYRCLSSDLIPVGGRQSFDIRLRVDKVVPNATGAVRINAECADCGGITADLNGANDQAKIMVNRSNGGGTGGGGGGTGTLPVTGTPTVPLVAVGAALLLAGVAGLVVARRRRIRFTA